MLFRRGLVNDAFGGDWLPKPKLRRTLRKSCVLEVPTVGVYEVVSDVQSYQEFVPYCVKSRVLHEGRRPSRVQPGGEKPGGKEDQDQGHALTEFDAELQIGFRLFHESHVSRVTCVRPRGDDGSGGYVRAEALPGGLCDSLVSLWSFEPTKSGGCKLSFHVDFEISNPLHAAAIAGFFEQVTLQQMDAFISRSRRLHHEAAARPVLGPRAGSGGAGAGAEADDDGEGSTLEARLSRCFDRHKGTVERRGRGGNGGGGTAVGLGLAEFSSCCRSLAREGLGPFERISSTPVLLASCFASFDRSGDGVVGRGGFVRGCSLLCEEDRERKARLLHELFRESSGGNAATVSKQDVKRAFSCHLRAMREMMPEVLRLEHDAGGEVVMCAAIDLLLQEAEGEVEGFVDAIFGRLGGDFGSGEGLGVEEWTRALVGADPEVADVLVHWKLTMLEHILEMTREGEEGE